MGDLTPDYRRGPWVFCVLDEPRVLDVRHEKAGLIVDGGEVARSLLSPFIVAPGPEPDSVEAMPRKRVAHSVWLTVKTWCGQAD